MGSNTDQEYLVDERRTRRKYEIQEDNNGSGVPYAGSRLDLKDPFKVLMENTRVQPNHRQYRNIRTMHGLGEWNPARILR